MNELKAHGLRDVLVAVVDGLKGFPAAIESVYPQATVQTCIVHMIRHSLAHASWQERKALAAALKAIYQAPREAAVAAALDGFEAGHWGPKYPGIVRSWRASWDRVVPFFAFSAPLRRAIYTTNTIESLNSAVRRAIRTRGHFPNDRAATKLIYLARRRAEVAGTADVLARRTHRVRDPLRRAFRDGGIVSSGTAFSPPCGAVKRRRAPGSVGLRPPYARRTKSLGARSGNPVRAFQYGRYNCRNRRTESGFAERWPAHVISNTHPVYHRVAHRIHAHIALAVIGLLLERLAEHAWRNIRADLKQIKLVQLSGPNGACGRSPNPVPKLPSD